MKLKYKNQSFEALDEMEEVAFEPMHPRSQKRKIKQASTLINQQDDSKASFKFTYKAARFEEGWLLKSLGGLFEQGWITDVLRKVKGGKEASVYLCRSGAALNTPFVAAKVYRPRSLRNLKQDHIYREGRVDLDSEGHKIVREKEVHALSKRGDYGEELRHQSWIAYEFNSLQALSAAGVDVPRPHTLGHNAILMEYIGDFALPAPALSEISLGKPEAQTAFERLVLNVERMLQNNFIHGDLSAYNILYWQGEIKLIDFPQVVSPQNNRNAFKIFERDLLRVCEYFIKMGVDVDPIKLADGLWKRRGLNNTNLLDPLYLDEDNPQDRQLWEKQNKP